MADEPSVPEPERSRAAPDPDGSEGLDEVFAGLLADPAVWVDARASLERDVVDAVRARAAASVRARERPSPHRRTYVAVTLAAAAVILAVLVATTVVSREDGRHRDFSAQLTGSALAPAARASAGITKSRGGFTVTLDARGLHRLPPEEFYQAWLKNDAGALVPIGTFSSGDSRITLWSGVSPDDFPKMTVTIERSDGDQSSSGRRVLNGTVHAS